MNDDPSRIGWGLAVLVVLSGCTFAPTETPSPTASPTAVRTPTPTADVAVSEWLATDGVTDAWALANAHREALADTAFTVHRTTTGRYANGSLRLESQSTARYAADRERYHVVGTFETSGSRVEAWEREVWSNGSTTVGVSNTTDKTTYTHSAVIRSTDYTAWERIYAVLVGMDSATVTPTIANESRAYRIVDRNVSNPRALASDGAILPGAVESTRNGSAAAVVRPDGTIRRVSAAVTVETETGTIDVVRTIRITDVGTTTVPRPEWVSPAINRTEA